MQSHQQTNRGPMQNQYRLRAIQYLLNHKPDLKNIRRCYFPANKNLIAARAFAYSFSFLRIFSAVAVFLITPFLDSSPDLLWLL